jgi:hypothetical protein
MRRTTTSSSRSTARHWSFGDEHPLLERAHQVQGRPQLLGALDGLFSPA